MNVKTDIRRWRVALLASIAALSLVDPVLCATADPKAGNRPGTDGHAERPPNILIILADDLGYGDLSSYGAPDLKTPHIDGLVSSGMRFDNSYANCPVCSPTRAALLTGRYPDVAGVPGVIRTHPENSWGFLDPSAATLPQVLKDAGYHTAIVGKWHLGLDTPNTPNERGFDEFHGFLGDMMDDYYDHRRHENNYMRHNGEVIDPKGHATDVFTQWAIDYLDERKGTDEPFFLYLAYNAPHAPIQPPDDWLARVRQREGDGITEQRAKLVALIEHLDDGVGRLLDALNANDQAENTLVVFTSDNGGQLSVGARVGDNRGGKGDLYEGGIRVPLCAVWPGKVRPGARSDRVALTMDLFPTVCEMAGVDVRETIDGTSILPTLLGRDQPAPDQTLFWMRREGGGRYLGQDYYAARRGPWKLVQNHPFEPYQLYHLGDDPLEERDRATSERGIVRELVHDLQLQLQRAGEVPWQPPSR